MLSRCPNFFFFLKLGLGKMIFSFSPYSQCVPTILPINQQWVPTRLPNMLLNFQHVFCHNPSLGLATKVRDCKVVGQEGSLGVMPHAPGSQESVREQALTFPKELPRWFGVLVDSQMFREKLQGSKPNGLKGFLYHWKSIETQMFKMISHHQFGHLKYKLWPKEGPSVKLTI